MLEKKIDMAMVGRYEIIEKYYGYNTEAYKVMRNNLCNGNGNGVPGIIFSAAW